MGFLQRLLNKLGRAVRAIVLGTIFVLLLALIPTLLKTDVKELVLQVLMLSERKAQIPDAEAKTVTQEEEYATLGILTEEKKKFIIEQAKLHGFNPAFLLAIAHQETQGNEMLGSEAGAIGLLQVTPGTAKLYCKDFVKRAEALWDWRINVRCGALILAGGLKENKGNMFKALYAYNGSGACKEDCQYQNCRLDKYGIKSCVVVCVNKCSQTFEYARAIINHVNELGVIDAN